MLLKVTTSHETYYLINKEESLAKRVKAEGRGDLDYDGEWFDFTYLLPVINGQAQMGGAIEVGKAMFFGRLNDTTKYRITTPVTSIEEVEHEE